MAIRLQGGFTSRQEGAVYVFNIYDSSYAGTVIPFDLAENGIVEEFDPEDKGRNQAIITSSMEIRLVVRNSSIESFIEDAANAAEGRFFLEVLKNGNKYWYGYVLPDQFTLNDLPYGLNPVLKIRATDGISRLKDIDYNNAGSSYTGKETFLQHLFNILGKISLESFYGATEDYLVTFVDWWDQNHVYDATTDPYALSRFDHKALIRVDSSGEVIYSSAYDVLEQIVKAWNCRFLFSDGTYKLVQINRMKTESGTKVLKVYDKNQGVTTTSTADLGIWNKSTGLLSGFQTTYDCYHNKGNYKYYPALRETQVEYEHFGTENLIPGQTWTQATAQTATYNDVDFNDGDARLSFSALLETRAEFTTPSEFQILTFWFQIQFKVGNYYLKRGYTFTGGKYTYQSFEWTTSPAYVDVFSEYMYTLNYHRYTEAGFTTPLLEEGGQLDITITRAGAYNTEGQQVFTTSTDFTPYYSWTNNSVRILVEGNVQDQTNIKVYNATNDDGSTNSKKETVQLLVGDGPSSSTFGAIEVYDSGNTEWVGSTGWRKGNSGTYREFGQLLANEILAGQKVAIRRYFGEVTGDFIAHGRLRRYAGETITNYIFIGGRHSLHNDRWDGEWFIIDVDNTGITSETPREFTDVIRPPFNKTPRLSDGLRGVLEGVDNPDVTPHDSTESSPVQIGINGPIVKDVETSTIPIDAIESDGYIFDGDELVIQTPTGEQIPVRVVGDVRAGDTSVTIAPITPGIDIPEGSTLVVPETDLAAYVQTSRKKQLQFWDVLRASDGIVDGDALYFFRVDESSKLYLSRATDLELQVYTPGSGGGQYSCLFKREGTTVTNLTVTENTTIARAELNYSLVSGLYTFHISSITGTTPIGVNILLSYVEPLQKLTYISLGTIGSEYPGDVEAFADGIGVDELYNMSLSNYHGMPYGLVIRNYTTISYASDSLAPVDDDAFYAVSMVNVYGMKVGAIRAKNYTGTTYASDAAAGVGGVDVGAYYILSVGNAYGVPGGFVKLRKS